MSIRKKTIPNADTRLIRCINRLPLKLTLNINFDFWQSKSSSSNVKISYLSRFNLYATGSRFGVLDIKVDV